MNPAFATAIFYGLLCLAWLLLRGSLTTFPDRLDVVLAFAVLVVGVAIWALGWRSLRPRARPLTGVEPRVNWRQFSLCLGLLALLLVLFAGPLPWMAEKFAGSNFVPGDRPRDTGAGSAGPSSSPSVREPEPGNSGSSPNSAVTTPSSDRESLVSQGMALVSQLPRWSIFLVLLALLTATLLAGWLAWRWLARRRDDRGASAPDSKTADQWVPRYLREFRRLCSEWGCPPEPGLTVREMLGKLEGAGRMTAPFEPMAVYHYRLFYEDAPAQPREEESLRRSIRRVRRHCSQGR